MDTLGSIFYPILQFLQGGFDKVNAVQGLLIALFATVLMRKWAQLFVIAFGATIIYIIVDAATPIVTKGAEIKLPPVMTLGFWQDGLSFFVGFVVIIAMFFAVRQVILPAGRKGGGKSAKAH
jgi:hypothetical protein